MEDMREPRLLLLDQLYCNTESNENFSLDTNIAILKIICQTFARKEKQICEQDLIKIADQIKCTRQATDCENVQLQQLILYMKEVIVTENKSSLSKFRKCLSDIKYSLQPREILEQFAKILKLKNYILSFFRSRFDCSNRFKFYSGATKFHKRVPQKEGENLIDVLYSICNYTDNHTCFCDEAYTLYIIFNQNNWVLNPSVFKGIVGVAHKIGTKVLKALMVYTANPEIGCRVLMALVRFIVQINYRPYLTDNNKRKLIYKISKQLTSKNSRTNISSDSINNCSVSQTCLVNPIPTEEKKTEGRKSYKDLLLSKIDNIFDCLGFKSSESKKLKSDYLQTKKCERINSMKKYANNSVSLTDFERIQTILEPRKFVSKSCSDGQNNISNVLKYFNFKFQNLEKSRYDSNCSSPSSTPPSTSNETYLFKNQEETLNNETCPFENEEETCKELKLKEECKLNNESLKSEEESKPIDIDKPCPSKELDQTFKEPKPYIKPMTNCRECRRINKLMKSNKSHPIKRRCNIRRRVSKKPLRGKNKALKKRARRILLRSAKNYCRICRKAKKCER